MTKAIVHTQARNIQVKCWDLVPHLSTFALFYYIGKIIFVYCICSILFVHDDNQSSTSEVEGYNYVIMYTHLHACIKERQTGSLSKRVDVPAWYTAIISLHTK